MTTLNTSRIVLSALFGFALVAGFASDANAQAVYNYDNGHPHTTTHRVARPISPYVAPPVNPGISQPYLGFEGRYVPGYGVQVLSVNRFSKAERIGLEPYDIIQKINGVCVHSMHQYRTLLREAVAFNGGQVSMVVKNSRPFPAPQLVTINFRLRTSVPCYRP